MQTYRTKQRQRELRQLLRRDHTLNGGTLFGLDGYIVEVQARAMEVFHKPVPWTYPGAVNVVGMAKRPVKEAINRIAGAFAKYGVPDPEVSVQINLAPASMPKLGTWLDLPMAVVMLHAAGVLPDLPEHIEGDFILMGELSLHGELRRVPGALSIAFIAKAGQSLIVPLGNKKECSLILAKPGHEGCHICAVSTLEEVIEFFQGKRKLEPATREEIRYTPEIKKPPDFNIIRGQKRAKEAATIAASGGHNLLMIGPPGEGKSLLASAMAGILPRLTDGEKVDLTRIYSAFGTLGRDGRAVTRRPVRTIHHTTSKPALVGGGSVIPRPGEITLAHLGVLFLDEIAEFSRSTLEALRQPLEDGGISISRVGATLHYPCRFTLVAAMNPCPCGYLGTESCTCSDRDIANYHKKLSGPLLDRIDLQVEVSSLSTKERFAKTKRKTSAQIRKRVEAARERQHQRFAGTDVPYNAAIPAGQVLQYCRFSQAGLETYRSVSEKHVVSTRCMDRLAKVARTVADLAGNDEVEPEYVEKAVAYVIGGVLRASL